MHALLQDRLRDRGALCSRVLFLFSLTLAPAQQVKSGRHTFHKKCFSCWSCQVPLALGGQSEGADGYPYCKKCYAAQFGPKGFRGGAVDGSISVSEHKFDTKSHVKNEPARAAPAPQGGVAKNFCSGCGAKLTAGAKFCASCGNKA